MSRIGKLPITVPAGLKIEWQNPLLKVKGPKGELSLTLHEGFDIRQEAGQLVVTRPSDEKSDKALHGTYRMLIHNMLEGVSKGYVRELEIVGVGYKAEKKGENVLIFTLGYSHDVAVVLPPGIKAEIIQERGQPLRIRLESADKQLIGQVAAIIRGLRPPDPYKGKGVRYAGEVLRLRQGKAKGKGKK
jgi:large subunit ribosomal protein L6